MLALGMVAATAHPAEREVPFQRVASLELTPLSLSMEPPLYDVVCGIAVPICGGGGGGGGSFTGGTVSGATTFQNTLTLTGNNAGATLGTNVVTNGTFTGSATGWTLGGGGGTPDWAYVANTVTHASGGGTTALQPSTPLTVTIGVAYKVSFVLSGYTTGTVTVSVGGVTPGIGTKDNGTFVYLIIATSTANLTFTPTNDFAATLDTVTVQTVTPDGDTLILADGATSWALTIGPPASRNFFLTGQTATPAGKNYASTGSSNNLCIGQQSCTALVSGTSNLVIGGVAGVGLSGPGGSNVLIGNGAGNGVKTGISNTCVGTNCMSNSGANHNNNRTTAIGLGAGNITIGNDNVFLGHNSGNSAQTASSSICIGAGANCTASNQLVVGGDAAGLGVTVGYLGQGVTKVSPTGFTLATTGGSGANNAGGGLTIRPGLGTGSAAGGDLLFQRSPSITAGSTAQTAVNAGGIRSQAKTLTDASATTFLQIAGLGAHGSAGVQVFWSVSATNGTDDQMTTGSLWASVVNTTVGAGGETCATGLVGTNVSAASTGTLTCTVTQATGTDLCDLRLNCDSSLDVSPTLFYSWLSNSATATVTPQ
jgi:hypothetical protein